MKYLCPKCKVGRLVVVAQVDEWDNLYYCPICGEVIDGNEEVLSAD